MRPVKALLPDMVIELMRSSVTIPPDKRGGEQALLCRCMTTPEIVPVHRCLHGLPSEFRDPFV